MKNALQNLFFVVFFCIVSINNFYPQQKTFELMKSRIENKQMLNNNAQDFIDKIKDQEVIESVWIFTTEGTNELEISDKVSLNLFEDGQYIAEKIEVEKILDNKFLWKGKIGEFGNASIFYNNGRITASINSGFDSYRIEPIQDGFHLLIKNDGEVINKAKCGNDDIEIPNRNENDFYDQMRKIESVTPKQDILVAYTSEVAAHHSDMEGFIQTVIGDAEAVYSNSSISIDLRLVHHVEIDYNETEDLSVDLNAFDSNPLVQNLRNKYLADACVLLVDEPESCGSNCIVTGIAWQYGGSSFAYAVVVDDYAGSSSWTLAHEIGHIQGANHDVDHASGYELPYGHGFISIPNDLITVMAYSSTSCPGQSCTKIGYFSNPNKTVNGVIIGTTQTEDNSRVLNETSNQIAGFRNATLSGTLSHDEFWQDSYTLQGNVFVPSGKTLTINSNATVNLGSYYIKSTGGSIVQNGSITGLNAYLKTGSTLKGLFPTIQLAINNASSFQTVELLSKTYSGSLSFSGKSRITLQGQGIGSTILNSSISVTNNSSYVSINNIRLNNVLNINNSSNTSISNCNIQASTMVNDYYGTQTNFGFSSGTLGGASFAYQSYNGTGDIYYTEISGGYDVGVYLVHNAAYNVGDQDLFCGNGYDIYAYNGGYAYAISNDYSAPVPQSIYGNVTITGINGVCGGLAKNSETYAFNEGNSISDSKNEDEKYLWLLRRISKDKRDDSFDLNNYLGYYNELITEYKDLFKVSTEKDAVKNSLLKLSHLYKAINQTEEFESFINSLMAGGQNDSFNPYIERYLIWSSVNNGSYNSSIELADKIISATKDEDLICEMKYEKGLIYKYYVQDLLLANNMFNDLIEEHKYHLLSKYALAQLNTEQENIFNESVKNDQAEGYSITGYPNPFNPIATINYTLPLDEKVLIKVYDILGRDIITLVNEEKQAGTYSVIFDASNFASGIYFYRIEAGKFSQTKKLILAK